MPHLIALDAGTDLVQPVASDGRLIVAALGGIAVIVVLIIAAKVHPFLALTIGALTVGLVAGVDMETVIASYSTGQKRKIALCAALVTDAPVMLLDEPFSGGLDPSALLAIKRILQHLATRDDVTILLATPVPELVTEIADRIAILRQGQIAAYDTFQNLAAQTHCRTLEEIYEQLVNPEHKQAFERYLEGQPR